MLWHLAQLGPCVSLDSVAYFWPPILLDKHCCSLSNDSADELSRQTLSSITRQDSGPHFNFQFSEMQLHYQSLCLTFETIGGSTNQRANRKQIPVRRHLAKCLSNLLSESLYHTIIFLKKHQLSLVIEKKG